MKQPQTYLSFGEVFFSTFTNDNRVDGVEGIADFAAQTLEHAKENSNVSIRTKFLELMLKLIQDYDAANAPSEDDNKFTPLEIQQHMVAAILEEISHNDDLALMIAGRAIKSLASNPAKISELEEAFTSARQELINAT